LSYGCLNDITGHLHSQFCSFGFYVPR